MTQHEWYLKRNCSLSPRQVVVAYGVQCTLSFAIATICTINGAWQVFIFSILEMLALGVAFLVYARHATDYEHIAFVDGRLLVERIEAGKIMQLQLDPSLIRVQPPKRYHDLIALESRGKRIEVGRFINNAKRKQVARELQSELSGSALASI